jgi:large subunit ribosomal protein L21
MAKKATAENNKEIAVIMSGGKQYVVSVGDTILVERLGADLKDGDKIVFDKVLLVDDGKDTTIGTPYISGAKITGKFVSEAKGPKISIVRYKAKSNRDRKVGHRQKYSKVTIESFK